MSSVQTPAPSVIVAVLTYRRPVDLVAVLPVLLEQVAEHSGPAGVLVVDNDPDGSAQAYVESLVGPVRYVHEPTPGIAVARNRALDEANSDILVFIDDDERPVEGWLGHLMRTWHETGADAVIGPVESHFTGELDPWIKAGGFFDRRRLATGARVTVGATNNMLLDVAALRRRGVRFDPRLGLIGGEDNMFTRQLTRAGGQIVWCAEALVHDIVPVERMTRRWAVQRAFRMGNGTSMVGVQLASTPLRRAAVRGEQTFQGAVRLVVGAARILLGVATRSMRRQAGGWRNCARGLGLITGSYGYVYAEYRRHKVVQPAGAESASSS
jgi:succinoglycan biosynthesis protein ExoM